MITMKDLLKAEEILKAADHMFPFLLFDYKLTLRERIKLKFTKAQVSIDMGRDDYCAITTFKMLGDKIIVTNMEVYNERDRGTARDPA